MTNNSKFLLLLLVFLGLNASLFSQIEGVVQGNNNGKISPLPGAVVQHLPSNTAITSDSLGRFSFPGWESGNQLIVSMTGFKSDTIRFDRQQSLSLILEQKSMLGEVEVQGPGVVSN